MAAVPPNFGPNTTDTQWIKKASKGVDCQKAIPMPSNPKDYMASLDYTVKMDDCRRISKLFQAAKFS